MSSKAIASRDVEGGVARRERERDLSATTTPGRSFG